MHDLYGIVPDGPPPPRRLVRHGHWPQRLVPDARATPARAPDSRPTVGSFPFVEVEGDGVYEIPVGPVHAGLIEPGHFRFSVVGETILRMKARLWFVHRGMEKLFEGRAPADGIELAERISGDTAVGHTLAYAMAVEEALGLEVASEDRLVGHCCSSSSACTTTSPTSARSPTTSATASSTPTPSGCARPCCGHHGRDRAPAAARRRSRSAAPALALPADVGPRRAMSPPSWPSSSRSRSATRGASTGSPAPRC